MNSARSTVLGWGALVAAAGVSFFYAKKGIDARRREQGMSGERPTEIRDWRQRIEEPAPQRRHPEHPERIYPQSPPIDDAYKATDPRKK